MMHPQPFIARSARRQILIRLQLAACLYVVVFFASTAAAQRLPIGFEHADRNSDGALSRLELIRYLSDRLQEEGAPYGKIFDELDKDGDRRLSEAEFKERHEAIDKILGPTGAPPADPGLDYKPFQGPGIPLDDVKTYGAIHARYGEIIADNEGWKASGWSKVKLTKIPKFIDLADKLPVSDPKPDSSIERVSQATAIVVGGGSPDRMFNAGAVLISPDGLALTNYHVAESFNDKLMALMGDGRAVRITKFLAGDRLADLALVQLEGDNFPWVPIARSAPQTSDDLFLVHHTENRYFTYNRGYVKRHIVAKDTNWMEIDGDYGPGGSGCGIYNRNHELIGLVSLIMTGDGPRIFNEDLIPPDQPADFDMPDSDNSDNSEDSTSMDDMSMEEEPLQMGVEVIRLAVPWISIDKITRPSK